MEKTSNIRFLGITLVMLFLNFIGISQTNYYVNDNSATGDVYCSGTFDGSGSGTSADPYNTLASVFSNHDLGSGDTIFVDAGSYTESFTTVGSNDEGFTIQGAGTNNTIFDGNDDGWFFLQLDDNNDDISFNDLTITNYLYSNNGNGAALRIIGICTNILLDSVIFDDVDCINGTNNYGGVITWGTSSEGSSMTITNSIFKNCDGGADGGVFVNRGISDDLTLTISKSEFYNNSSTNSGSSIYDNSGLESNPVVSFSECKFYGNSSTNNGDFFLFGGTFTLTNCLIYENSCTTNEGVFFLHTNTDLILRNVTMVDNTGGGIYLNHSSVDIWVYSSIIQDNTGQNDIYLNSNGDLHMYHSIYNTITGTIDTDINNETTDATFVDAANDDYQLDASSNGIDEGYNTGAPSIDLINGSRDDGFNDMGAYEYGATILPVELLSFEGRYNSGEIELTWTTATELNNDYFIVYKLIDDEWVEVDRVFGNGTTTDMNEYVISDTPTHSINYYKLKQVDYDGKFEIFGPITVNIDPEKERNTYKDYDYMGREVNPLGGGFIIRVWDNGDVEKLLIYD